MQNAHKFALYAKIDVQFFAAFTQHGLFRSFPGFDFSARKFPFQRTGFVFRTPTDENFTILFNDCSNNFNPF